MTPKQKEAADLLAAGSTASDVARVVGVDRTTLWRWQDKPEFRTAVEGARSARLSAAADALIASVPHAVAALVAMVQDPDAPPGARVSAAREILDRAGLVTPDATKAVAERPREDHRARYAAMSDEELIATINAFNDAEGKPRLQ